MLYAQDHYNLDTDICAHEYLEWKCTYCNDSEHEDITFHHQYGFQQNHPYIDYDDYKVDRECVTYEHTNAMVVS